MKITSREFFNLVSTMAPPEIACSWDNSGFQVGDEQTTVNRVLCALEVTPAVVREAQERKAQLILVHHPLIFRPLSAITASSPIGRLVMEMIRSELCLVVAHTNLDKSPYGTNRAVAELLDLNNLDFLEPENASGGEPRFGLGYTGELRKAVSFANFAEGVKKALKTDHLRVSGPADGVVRRVAVMTGAGGDAARNLRPEQADVLVTGEINHHAALEAGFNGLSVICAGHFSTEIVGMEYFMTRLQNNDEIIKAGVELLWAGSQESPYRIF